MATRERAKRGEAVETDATAKIDYHVIERQVPARRGRWRLLPPEVTGGV